MQFFTIGIVVNMTITENRYVQIGSKYQSVGHMKMMTAAIMTPTDISISPITCRKAASMFMLPVFTKLSPPTEPWS